jgi:hypothetical protein
MGLIGAKERSDSMAMTVVDKDCTEKAEDFTDHLLNMGYTKGMKDGYAKAIEEFAEALKKQGNSASWRHFIDRIAKELKGE